MQPTNLLDPAAGLSGDSHWDETSPRNMGPNIPCRENFFFFFFCTVNQGQLRIDVWTSSEVQDRLKQHIQSSLPDHNRL